MLRRLSSQLATRVGRRRASGFTILEIAVVIAIVGLLAGMGLMAFSNLKGSVKMKNLTGDLVSTMAHAHARAIARQRTQLIVVDAILGANGTYGFYHFEDAAVSPNIFAPTDLSTVLGSLNPSQPSTAPSPYLLRLVDSNFDPTNQYLTTSNAWGSALPFPFAPVPTNTSAGCSFCAAGTGAVAFLPNGRAIFSDGNAVGGLILVQSLSSTGGKSGVAISPTGFFQKMVPQ